MMWYVMKLYGNIHHELKNMGVCWELHGSYMGKQFLE